MMRKTFIALFALAAVGLIQSTVTSSRGGGGGSTGTHNPVWMSMYIPGRQNGAHPLVTPVSPGRHAVLTAGGAMRTGAIAAASATADSAAIKSRRIGSV